MAASQRRICQAVRGSVAKLAIGADARIVTENVSIDWSKWVRQAHRWLSIVFTMTVIANFVAMGFGKPPASLVYSPLPPLFLMLDTGLYMFVLPYAAKRRSAR